MSAMLPCVAECGSKAPVVTHAQAHVSVQAEQLSQSRKLVCLDLETTHTVRNGFRFLSVSYTPPRMLDQNSWNLAS